MGKYLNWDDLRNRDRDRDCNWYADVDRNGNGDREVPRWGWR